MKVWTTATCHRHESEVPTMSNFLLFNLDDATPEVSGPAAERLISGNPRFHTWNLEETAGGVYSGIWQATPGKWRVEYAEWEFCHIFSGVSILSEDEGAAHTLRAGDCFVIRPGFRGCWEVVETTRKAYVIKI